MVLLTLCCLAEPPAVAGQHIWQHGGWCGALARGSKWGQGVVTGSSFAFAVIHAACPSVGQDAANRLVPSAELCGRDRASLRSSVLGLNPTCSNYQP